MGPAMRHGHGARADEIDKDWVRFFRTIDREVLDRLSGPSRRPLVLVGLPESQAVFRSVSKNPFLAADTADRSGSATAGSLRAFRLATGGRRIRPRLRPATSYPVC
ncbi:MAG: baeRF6 domain-containing protein [Pirellulaceae bacterium]